MLFERKEYFNMKITFLGTSHGVPAADRYCSCMMIESGHSIYLIDAGAPVIDLFLRNGKSVSDLRAVFTTHVHTDHTNGIFPLVNLMNWWYKDSEADFYMTEQPLIDAWKNLNLALGSALSEERIRFHVVEELDVYEDENIKVQYIPTQHMAPRPSYAILVTEGDRRVLFSGDFSNRLKKQDVPAILAEEPFDAFVCEMAHFGVEDLKPYLEICKAKCVYFTHVYPLTKYEEIEAMKPSYPFSIVSPSDGDSFTV